MIGFDHFQVEIISVTKINKKELFQWVSTHKDMI